MPTRSATKPFTTTRSDASQFRAERAEPVRSPVGRNRRSAALQMAIALAVGSSGVAACGAGEDTLTAAQWRVRADAICVKGNQAIEAASASAGLGPGATTDQLNAFLGKLIDVINGQINDIDALRPPADLATQVDAFVSSARTTTATIKTIGSQKFFEQMESGSNPFAATNELAAGLGLTACAES